MAPVFREEYSIDYRTFQASRRVAVRRKMSPVRHRRGLSKRTLENWEQGRAEPTGPAKVLLKLVSRYPDTLKRLARIQPDKDDPVGGFFPTSRYPIPYQGPHGRILR